MHRARWDACVMQFASGKLLRVIDSGGKDIRQWTSL